MDAPEPSSPRAIVDLELPPSMRALVRDHGRVVLAERPTPRALAADEALIRVAVTGLCRTDCLVADGALGSSFAPADQPLILGHELAGTLVARGSAVDVALGTLVSVDPRIPCRACPSCEQDQPCPSPRMLGVDLDGAFAEYLRVPGCCLVPAPPGALTADPDLRALAYVEPIAASLAVLDTGIRPDQRGLVLGSGRIAALTLAVLEHHGYADLTSCDPLASAPEPGFEFVIETQNDPASLALAVRLLRPGGRLILKSRTVTPLVFDPLALIRKRLTLVAADYGSFTEAAALICAGGLVLSGLWTRPRPLDDHAELFAAARRGEDRKQFFTLAP
jgi:L-iditol 2-dehydrogenase